MPKNSKVAVIIPCRGMNNYLQEAVLRVLELDYPDFEVLVLPDETIQENFPKTKIIPSGKIGPAEKRNLAFNHTDAQILAFLDDDSYPERDWLKNALMVLEDKKAVAVCGPALTPVDDNFYQKVSGYVWSSWLGAGGAGTYRCAVSSRREVDDYPSVNFLVRREDFEAVQGFNSGFWPGEDSKFCLDLTKKLGKKIIYDPKIVVWHHRRPVFGPHLAQIARYGLHRGYFARVLPETSRRLNYFIPSFFAIFLLGFPVFSFLCSGIRSFIFLGYSLVLFFYFLLLTLTAAWVYSKESNFKIAILTMPAIFLTHVWYGLKFIQGFFSRKLKY